MYKVFNNLQKIIIAKSDVAMDFGDAVVICIRDVRRLPEIIESHVFGNDELDLILLSAEPDELVSAFENLFEIRIAGGGWVFNNTGSLLMIKRNGLWDIPKGHLNKNESIEECAMREVTEETGVENIIIDGKLGISRHIYSEKGKNILKFTHWYLMKTAYSGALKPQRDEGITKAKWVKSDKIGEKLQKGWLSLFDFWLNDVKIGSSLKR